MRGKTAIPSPPASPMSHPQTRRALLMRAAKGSLSLALTGLLASCRRSGQAPIDGTGRTDFAPPFAIAPFGTLRPLWTLDHGAHLTDPAALQLARGSTAESPWIDSTPGARYQLTIVSTGNVQVATVWMDAARQPLAHGAMTQQTDGTSRLTLTTPADAVGCRLQLSAEVEDATITALSLVLAGGVRVESFPNFQRAAFAFSYDWESAMGGLIHTRSAANSEGNGTPVALQGNGSPVVADAEENGLRMRDGARFLAARFAEHGINATFYTTGYNLLTGNPARERFLGDPIYPNADTAHGWGSDYWRTHSWYGYDPYGTEQMHPAWYFASQTRELAAAGHEIASHTFGHLYVRGVRPEQLAADLHLWRHTASDLGVPIAPSFAFPWTSSNSLDARFWAIFVQFGWTVLTRLYPRDLRHPFELDVVPAEARLCVFPDFYLPSHLAMLKEACARIEETLARRGYHSFWTHPYAVLEQDGVAVWSRVIEAVSDARARGLWVAPVAQIARYALAARQVVVRADARGSAITVENRSDQTLEGLTLTFAWRIGHADIDGSATTEVRGDQVRLPPMAPGRHVRVEASAE